MYVRRVDSSALDFLLLRRTLMMDFILTHTRYGRSNLHPMGQITHTSRSDEPDGVLKTVVRAKIIHYCQVYLNRSDPIAFMPS